MGDGCVLGTFGSSVGSLFTFARWLFFLNVLLFVVWLLLVLIPQSIHFDYSTVTASFSFMDLVNGMVPTLTHPPHHTGHTPHTPFTASLPRSASWTLSTAWYQHSHTLHTPHTPLTHPSHPSHTLHTVTASFSVMDLINGVVLTLTHPPHHTRHTRHTPSTPHPSRPHTPFVHRHQRHGTNTHTLNKQTKHSQTSDFARGSARPGESL